MAKSDKFSPEVRERAVRMVQEHQGEYPSLWTAIESITPEIGCAPQTLLEWVKRHEIDSGARDGITSSELQRLKELDRENKGLRKAAEILKLAKHFALAELDRRLKFWGVLWTTGIDGPTVSCRSAKFADRPIGRLAPRNPEASAAPLLTHQMAYTEGGSVQNAIALDSGRFGKTSGGIQSLSKGKD